MAVIFNIASLVSGHIYQKRHKEELENSLQDVDNL